MISTLQGTKDGMYASAGAVVALKVNTGETLAAATYPSYSIDTYNNDYNSLLSDKAQSLV